jgi:hypothetical protein
VEGTIIGLGKFLKHGKRLALAEARVKNAAGFLLATARHHHLMALASLIRPD